MLIFDQLKKNDPQLRFLATAVFGGMVVLFAGLWWVQVVSSRYYQDKLETQSIRTVRIPAVRGNILDREGRPLAENKPSYNIDLTLEDLTKYFQAAYANALSRARRELNSQMAAQEKRLNRKLTAQEKKQFVLPTATRAQLQQQTRYQVTSNIVAELSRRLREPVAISEKDFQRRYDKARALPLPVLPNINPVLLARFEEQSIYTPGMDLDIQSIRSYPNGALGAHLLGYLVRNNESSEGEIAEYNYRLDDYIGISGIEGLYDPELRGKAGAKSVIVNNLGYRQSETIWSPVEPGQNVTLTIDLDIQKAAETALRDAQANVRGAVVVMDARNGDVLAMASAPSYDPNHFIVRPDPETWAKEHERWTNSLLGIQRNRAIYENYHPGSIFKIVVGLAALEQGVLDPKAFFHSDGYYRLPGRRPIGDTAGEGEFDFNRALAKSSNPYFITQGLKPGVLPKIIALGRRLHLGERTGIMPHQEASGNFPTLKRIASAWRDGDTANLSIGQGEIDVTPIQMAVMTAAVANGGKVLQPRLVARVDYPDSGEPGETFAEGTVRDNMGVSQRSLGIVRDAMLQDVESPEGTGHEAAVPGLRIAGKTGTAEVERLGRIDKSAKDTWFVSFAPYENPRYVVVAAVEGGASGGKTCVPIAHKVYLALQLREQQHDKKVKPDALASSK
ncbi:MAG TPA: penicillin-binding transpeptidase domain-containing protein [Verrucomicrobiae bacterium]|nr:penicillin-binding transpeptidase domain-containing protein [Verrucomicrobiae bacterium]